MAQKEVKFTYPSRGPGRPQILLLGNGLEYSSNQKSWEELLEALTVPGATPLTEKQRKETPFPLLYELLTTPSPAPAQLRAEDIRSEEERLKSVMAQLTHETNPLLDIVPSLHADHILTTNYSYCIERAFSSEFRFEKSHVRKQHRFALAEKPGKDAPTERQYRLRSGYLLKNTAIWHIHGECAASEGIVLGHDRYGRLTQRIAEICGKLYYPGGGMRRSVNKNFHSWPELFLYADVHVLGFGFDECEFDLWWLLRRKQRELYADGKVYFYERRPPDGYQTTRHLLLQANGAVLCSAGKTTADDFDSFYRAALTRIGEHIEKAHEARAQRLAVV